MDLKTYKLHIRVTMLIIGVGSVMLGILAASAAPLELNDLDYGRNTGFFHGIAAYGVIIAITSIIMSICEKRNGD